MTRIRFAALSWVALTLILSLGDHFFHVRTDVLHYSWPPLVDGQSVWAWLVFSVAGAAMIAATGAFPLRDIPSAIPWSDIARTASIFIAVYAISGVVGESHPTVLFLALVATWLARVLIRREDRFVYFVHGVVVAAAGVVAEGLFSKAGLFAYDLQQIVDCPWWLGGLYLHGSFALLQVARGWKSFGRTAQRPTAEPSSS